MTILVVLQRTNKGLPFMFSYSPSLLKPSACFLFSPSTSLSSSDSSSPPILSWILGWPSRLLYFHDDVGCKGVSSWTQSRANWTRLLGSWGRDFFLRLVIGWKEVNEFMVLHYRFPRCRSSWAKPFLSRDVVKKLHFWQNVQLGGKIFRSLTKCFQTPNVW